MQHRHSSGEYMELAELLLRSEGEDQSTAEGSRRAGEVMLEGKELPLCLPL